MGVTPLDFAKALTGALGVPASANNLAALVAWQAQEGGNYVNTLIEHNPMNTFMPGFGGTLIPGVAMSYPTWSQGLAATVATLKGTAYAGVRAALAQSADPAVTLAAANDSPWLGYQSPGRNQYSTNWQAFQYYANKVDPVGGSLGLSLSPTLILGGLAVIAVAGWIFRGELVHTVKALQK